MTAAKWAIRDLGKVSVGEVVRVSLTFKDAKLEKFLKSQRSPDCVMEREEKTMSVTLGFIVERFSHMLDVIPPERMAESKIDSMAWVKPMDRSVEFVMQYLYDRDSCDGRLLGAMGAKRTSDAEA